MHICIYRLRRYFCSVAVFVRVFTPSFFSASVYTLMYALLFLCFCLFMIHDYRVRESFLANACASPACRVWLCVKRRRV